MKHRIFYTVLLCLLLVNGFGQQLMSLDDVLRLGRSSYFVDEAKVKKEIAAQDFQFFRSQLKPQIGFDLLVPNFTKTSTEIIQPSGSVAFQSISQNNASLSLYASQALRATGGRIFIQSDLQRFDDFTNEAKLYNGLPVRVGIEQPLFGYNPFKVQSKIQSLQLKESEKQYNIDIENTHLTIVGLYFDILIAAENRSIASANQVVNKDLLRIADERFRLGKISKDENLQLQIELKSAELNNQQAQLAYRTAQANLFNYLGLPLDTSAVLDVPDVISSYAIDMAKVEQAALQNSPLFLSFERRMLERQDEIAQQKATYGIKASLFASYGYARGSDQLQDIYQNPFDEQQVRLSLSIPLVDWGRKKSAVRRATLSQELEQKSIKQETLEFQNNVRQTAFRLMQFQTELNLLESIVQKSKERGEISNQRYVLGDISITDLTIAQREKDQARRDFILALRNYYVEYYRLRLQTGFDARLNQNIIYE